MKTVKLNLNIVLIAALSAVMLIQCASPQNHPEENIPTSKALPAGMAPVWADEFNGNTLDTGKWFTDYYSTLDFAQKTNYEQLLAGTLPPPAIRFTGQSIVLYTDSQTPAEAYWPSSGRKISSIQTYDWRTDRLLLDNRLGGFIEARIKRSAAAGATMVNGAFWLDSPGPDARYFIEKGNTALGVAGIRPRGQVFEIDLCENLNTEIVLHGNVSPEGVFEHNIGHAPLRGKYKDRWVVHSMLWTPAGLKFYIDGELKASYWDPHDIKSPNHAMNMFLGMYGKGDTATMEVDYIRYYQWQLDGKNELPNPGFEYHSELFPWEGKATVSTSAARTGKHGVELLAGDTITQYVYLDHSHTYSMKFWCKGAGNIDAGVENITQVSGLAENRSGAAFKAEADFTQQEVLFFTNPEFGNHKRTVKITLVNTGSSTIVLDDLTVEKRAG